MIKSSDDQLKESLLQEEQALLDKIKALSRKNEDVLAGIKKGQHELQVAKGGRRKPIIKLGTLLK